MTEKELHEILQKTYGLVPQKPTYKIRDGVVTEGDEIWWRGANGPEKIIVGAVRHIGHIGNIQDRPEFYQIAEPKFHITYED